MSILRIPYTIMQLFRRGLQWDKLETECDIMGLDAVSMVKLADAAIELRRIIDGENPPEVRDRAWKEFCRAVDRVMP